MLPVRPSRSTSTSLQVEIFIGFELLVAHTVQQIIDELVEAGFITYLSVRSHHQVIFRNHHYQLVLPPDCAPRIVAAHPDLVAVALAAVVFFILFIISED